MRLAKTALALWLAVAAAAICTRLGAVAGAPSPWLAALLLASECALIASAAAFFGTLVAGLDAPLAEAAPPPSPEGSRAPAIDILIPTLDEEPALLRRVVRRALAAELAHETWVLDDGGREEVRALCAELGARYLSRPDRGRGKKAGNLNAGMRASRGELVLVIDADALVRPTILSHLAPLFEADPRLGLAQAPQVYHNVDAFDADYDPRRRDAWSASELFQLHMQRGFQALGGAICVGSGYLARRAAIEAAGGFDEAATSEDVRLGLAMRRAGYATRFVEEALLYHLAPDGLGQEWRQRIRWARGDLEILGALLPVGRLRPTEWLIFARHALSPLFSVVRSLVRFTAPVLAIGGATVYAPQVALSGASAALSAAAYAGALVLPAVLTRGRMRVVASRSLAHFRVGHALGAIAAILERRLGLRSSFLWSTPKGAGVPAPRAAYAVPVAALLLGGAGLAASVARAAVEVVKTGRLAMTAPVTGALSLEVCATGALALRIVRGRREAREVTSQPVRRAGRFRREGEAEAAALEVVRLGTEEAYARGPEGLATGPGTLEVDLADGTHALPAVLAAAPPALEPAPGPGEACWRLALAPGAAARDRLADAIDGTEIPRFFASLALPPFRLPPGDPPGDPRGIPLYALRPPPGAPRL